MYKNVYAELLATVNCLEQRLNAIETEQQSFSIKGMADSILVLQKQINTLHSELEKLKDPENDMFRVTLTSKTPIRNVASLKKSGIMPIEYDPNQRRKFVQVYFVIEDFVTVEVIRDDNPALHSLGIFK